TCLKLCRPKPVEPFSVPNGAGIVPYRLTFEPALANFLIRVGILASSAVSSVSDASRPQLFGQLGPDIFTVFSGGNRLLYERAILAVYDDLWTMRGRAPLPPNAVSQGVA